MRIDKSKLGKAIGEIRTRLGMTQRDLAERSGLTVNYLSLLENGKRGIGLDRLNILANVFGIPALLIMSLAADFDSKLDSPAARVFKQLQTTTRHAIDLYVAL